MENLGKCSDCLLISFSSIDIFRINGLEYSWVVFTVRCRFASTRIHASWSIVIQTRELENTTITHTAPIWGKICCRCAAPCVCIEVPVYPLWRAVSPSPSSGSCLCMCAEYSWVWMENAWVFWMFSFTSVCLCGYDSRIVRRQSSLSHSKKKEPKTLALICIVLVGTIEFGFCTSTWDLLFFLAR